MLGLDMLSLVSQYIASFEFVPNRCHSVLRGAGMDQCFGHGRGSNGTVVWGLPSGAGPGEHLTRHETLLQLLPLLSTFRLTGGSRPW